MKAREGVKIRDCTHVRSGPTGTQLLAWFGAGVFEVECAGAEYAPGGNNQTMDK